MENQGLVKELRTQVSTQIGSMTTELPRYEELSEENKARVEDYIKTIDLKELTSIDGFGKQETKDIYDELDVLIGTLKTNDISITEMFTDLMLTVDEGQNRHK